MMTSSSMARPQTTSSGPKCLSGGIVSPRNRRAPWARTWRVSRRELAREPTKATLADSAGGQGVVDPVDHPQPEAGEQCDEREQVRVRVREREADDEVRGQAQSEEPRADGQAQVREQLVALDEDRGEARGDEQRGGDEPEQLP